MNLGRMLLEAISIILGFGMLILFMYCLIS
jgi:hypothetical protein